MTEHAAEATPTTTASAEVEEFDTVALAEAIAEAAWDRKARNVRVVDVRGLASYADFLVICHGTGERHAKTIADFVVEDLRPVKVRPYGKEGFRSGDWLLVDFGDAVLHVFAGEARQHYALESLWSDAPRLPLDAPGELEFPEEEAFAT